MNIYANLCIFMQAQELCYVLTVAPQDLAAD